MAYNKPPKITGQMPARHHADDAQWIFSKLLALQFDERSKVCKAYSNAFQAAHDKELNEHQKDGKARYAANNRLRIYIAKKFSVFNK